MWVGFFQSLVAAKLARFPEVLHAGRCIFTNAGNSIAVLAGEVGENAYAQSVARSPGTYEEVVVMSFSYLWSFTTARDAERRSFLAQSTNRAAFPGKQMGILRDCSSPTPFLRR